MPTTLKQIEAAKRQLREQLRKLDDLSGTTRKRAGEGDRHREAMAAKSREKQAAAADIGEIPAVVNSKRKEACRNDLFLFLTTYFPHSTGLSPFSEDHKKVIARIQYAIIEGGRYVNAVYRAFAKSTISENSALWSTLYGHRAFVPVFSADKKAADDIIDSLKKELFENDLLMEDFPEVCHAVRCLDNKPQRAASQTHRGKHTHIEWTADTVVFPTIDGSIASGAILCSKGIESASRGMKYKRVDGYQVRPDFVIIDDPQTEESGGSVVMTRSRMKIIKKAILRMVGHKRALAVVVNGTPMQGGDLIEQLLDPKQNASWQGERIPMLKSLSDAHDDFWLGEYATMRQSFDRDNPQDQTRARQAANELYQANRQRADSGCVVSWEHCYQDDEVSAIQHAYNILIDDGPDVFASECQVNPLETGDAADKLVTLEILEHKLNGLPQHRVPKDCTRVTAYIDVHKQILYYVATAWNDRFGGAVIDYGTWPDQPRRHFQQSDPPLTMESLYGGGEEEAWILAGLADCASRLLSREYTREDGASLGVERLLIDTQYHRDLVQKFVRRHERAAQLMPSVGGAIGAKKKPFEDYRDEPGKGLHCIERMKAGEKHVWVDTYWWKTFIAKRLVLPLATPGGIEIYGRNPFEHRLLFEHWTSEKSTEVTAYGVTVREWDLLPNRDNHWWDTLVGSGVGASLVGIRPAGLDRSQPKPRRSLAELAAAAKRTA